MIGMKKCEQCGMDNDQSFQFCSSCGGKLESETATATPASVKEEQPKQTNHKEVHKMNGLFSKKILVPVALIALLFIGGFSYMGIGSTNAKPVNVVEQFEDAIVDGDPKKLIKLMVPGDPLLELDEANAKKLIAYYKKNPSAFVDEMKQLKTDASMWKDDSSAITTFSDIDDEVDRVLTFVKRKEKQGMFGKYAIEVKPLYVKVRTNQEGTILTLNDKEILTAKVDYYDRVLGPYMPGEYTFAADYDGEYVSLSTEKEVKLPKDHDKEVDLSLDVQYIYPESNDLEASLYINGKDTGKLFKDMNYFGPVASDGTMTVQAKKQSEWGMLESDVVTITAGDAYPYLELKGLYVYPTSNVSGAKLLINDKNTGVSIDDASYSGYGPLPYQGAFTMQAEKIFPWGTFSSEKKPVVEYPSWEDEDLSINPLDTATKDQIMADTNEFLVSMIDALDQNDASLLNNATPYFEEYFTDYMLSDGFDGYLMYAAYEMDTFDFYEDEYGDYIVNFTGLFTTNEIYYSDDYEPYDYEWEFTVVYDQANQKWMFDDFMGGYFYGENIREFTFE